MKTSSKSPIEFEKSNNLLARTVKRGKVRLVGNAQNDRLEILRKDCEQQIRQKEQELQVLRAKLNTILGLAYDSEKLVTPEPADKYAGLGLTESILDAIACLWRDNKGTARGVLAVQIRDFILAHGFPLTVEPKNFSTAITVTLGRLSTGLKKRIECTEFAGKNYYRPLDAYK